MRAITVRQPYAWAVFHANPRKDIENRRGLARWEWLTGERIAIHSGLAWHESGAADPIILEALGLDLFGVARRDDPRFQLGAIIGTATVDEVHVADECCDPWGWAQNAGNMSRDPVVHIELGAARACDPIPCRGALGVWRVPDEIATDLREAAGR